MNYYVRQLEFKDISDASKLIISRIDDNFYGSEKKIPSAIVSVLTNPEHYLITELLDKNINFNSVNDMIYVPINNSTLNERRAIIGLFDKKTDGKETLLSLAFVKNMSSTCFYYAAIYFIISDKEYSNSNDTEFLILETIKRLKNTGVGVIYTYIPTDKIESSRYLESINKEYDTLEIGKWRSFDLVNGFGVFRDLTLPNKYFPSDITAYTIRSKSNA